MEFHPQTNREAVQGGGVPGTLEFDIISWNVGGLTAENALDILESFRGGEQLQHIGVALLQEVILRSGVLHRESDNWSMVASKQTMGMEGSGGGTQKESGLTGGLTTTLLLKGGCKIRCLSGHIPHHATVPETSDILTGRGGHLSTGRLIIGMDANEVFSQPFTTAVNSSTGRGEHILRWACEHNITFPLQDINTPTHFPYNTRLAPRRLDYVACRNMSHEQGKVVACKHRAATDHDGVQLTLQLHAAKHRNSSENITGGPRRLKAEGVVEHTLCQPIPRAQDPHLSIANAAKVITRPGRFTIKYSESPALKQLCRAARDIPPGEEAKQA